MPPARWSTLRRCSYDFDRWFEYCGWGLERMAGLMARIRSPRNLSPWAPGADSPEHWLAHSFGGFCWHERPALASDLVQQVQGTFPGLTRALLVPARPNLLPWSPTALY